MLCEKKYIYMRVEWSNLKKLERKLQFKVSNVNKKCICETNKADENDSQAKQITYIYIP